MSDGLLIQLLQKNARYKVSDLAAALAESKDSIVERLNRLEKEKIICGYHTIVNWDKTNTELVTAMIEINAIPEREYGYDRIASHVYKYEEIETMYLLSGDYDFMCIVKGRTMQEARTLLHLNWHVFLVLQEQKTTFVLKPYKTDGHVLVDDEDGKNTRLVVTP